MSEERRRPVVPRADRVLPGIWRLRLPLPWPGVPHGNAWAVASDGGITLFDTGIGGEGRLAGLGSALSQAGHSLADVRLLVCTHAHADHYGLAAPIVEASGCELWIHPAWDHVRSFAEDPDAALDQRIEIARQSGVPPAGLEPYERALRGSEQEIGGLVPPDRELVPGVKVPTGFGDWDVYETPGHAPSHVCLHQPESRLLISGDHLLGRISLYYDHGYTPDPVGEYLRGLDEIEALRTGLCLPGHGRPFRDVPAKIAATRAEVWGQLERVRGALRDEPRPAFVIVAELVGVSAERSGARGKGTESGEVNPALAAWGLQIALAYLDHLELAGEAERVEEGGKVSWRRR